MSDEVLVYPKIERLAPTWKRRLTNARNRLAAADGGEAEKAAEARKAQAAAKLTKAVAKAIGVDLGPPDENEKPEPGTPPSPPPEGEWSSPMALKQMAGRLNLRPDAFKTFAGRHGLRKINRQLWQVRLDGMDGATRQKLEKGRPGKS